MKTKIRNLVSGLTWNTYIEHIGNNDIGIFNIFKHSYFVEQLVEAILNYTSKQAFEKDLEGILNYCFGHRSQYEVIITSNPAYIDKTDALKLYDTIDAGDLKIRNIIKLAMGTKVSIYDQVVINWKAFVSYLETEVLSLVLGK